MLDLSTLKAVLAPLCTIGKDEHTFEVGEHRITLCPLLPHEEVAVQRYASELVDRKEKTGSADEDAGMDRADALDYFDRFRIEVVAHAICQIDDFDLRGQEYVSTGETTDSGAPVRITRGQAVRELIRQGWSRTMITSTFSQYGELVERLSIEADKIASRSMSDLDVEIERTTERLQKLKDDRRTRAAGDPSVSKEQIQGLVEMGTAEAGLTSQHARQHQAERKAERAFNPHQDPPTAVTTAVAPTEASAPDAPPTEDPPTEAQAFGDIRSSFEDGEDPEVVAQETRIIEARRRAAADQRKNLSAGASSGLAEPAGMVGGVDAYRLPATELSPRGKKDSPKEGHLEVDPKARGERNPKFGGK